MKIKRQYLVEIINEEITNYILEESLSEALMQNPQQPLEEGEAENSLKCNKGLIKK